MALCHYKSELIILYFAINYVIFNVPIGNCLRQWIGAAGSEVSPSRVPVLDGRLLFIYYLSNKCYYLQQFNIFLNWIYLNGDKVNIDHVFQTVL